MGDDIELAQAQAATNIRLALARVYGRDGMSTAHAWHVLPCLTPGGTLGVLDIAAGTAWETGVAAAEDAETLGTSNAVYAAASMAPGADGTVRIDRVPVQHDGTAVVDGEVVPPSMPEGWRQILLPTWRGYEGDGHARVPVALYRPENWIEPRRVAAGLMTCYGKPGDPERGRWLDRCVGWEGSWPHGVPPWIDGQSVTVLDRIADARYRYRPENSPWLVRTQLVRGSDQEECWRLLPLIAAARHRAVRDLRYIAQVMRQIKLSGVPEVERVADAMEAGEGVDAVWDTTAKAWRDPAFDALSRAERRNARLRADCRSYHVTQLCRAIQDAEEACGRLSPWEAAEALDVSHADSIFAGVWPGKVYQRGVPTRPMVDVDGRMVDVDGRG